MYPLISLAWIFALIFPSILSQGNYLKAVLGGSKILTCTLEFPGGQAVPYIIQWSKQDLKGPVYIWYDGYPPHVADEYEGRVSIVNSSRDGNQASLNLTDIQAGDQGWYECKVLFLNRRPNDEVNGTWIKLDVHAPPTFSATSDDIIYVNESDGIILTCEAVGTPTPSIMWYKESDPIAHFITASKNRAEIYNDGMELRIMDIQVNDTGDFVCIAKNEEGQIHHTSKVVIAGEPIIVAPPQNLTHLEGNKAELSCEARGLPDNITITWFKDSIPLDKVTHLLSRISIKSDGSLWIDPLAAEDTGSYMCEVSNGIGQPKTASAYLNVEFPARVEFTPSTQYLPLNLKGMIHCPVMSNPPLKFVTWKKDKRVYKVENHLEVIELSNGSLLFHQVAPEHEGEYTCTPFNFIGTAGESETILVLVRDPPEFTVRPKPMYQQRKGKSIFLPCVAIGTPKPYITWRKVDGTKLPKNRHKVVEGNLTIENLHQEDTGLYECVVSNEVTTIVASTQVLVEGTTPHPPYNVTVNVSQYAVTLQWLPGYSGGEDYTQEYLVWYNERGMPAARVTVNVPPGQTKVTIKNLTPNMTYDFEIMSKNQLGDGIISKKVTATTKEKNVGGLESPPGETPSKQQEPKYDEDPAPAPDPASDSTGASTSVDKGPKPNAPHELNITEAPNGIRFIWLPPLDNGVAIGYYTIDYRIGHNTSWKRLNPTKIKSKTDFVVRNTAGLIGGRTYQFRVNAHHNTNFASSTPVKFLIPKRLKDKALTAGVVGGLLFFLVAIILSICAVKICNKRKRKRHEKAYNMVACRVSEAKNGGHFHATSPVPSKKCGKSRIPFVTKRTARNVYSLWSHKISAAVRSRPSGKRSWLYDDDETDNGFWTLNKIPRAVCGQRPLLFISRSPDGKFVVDGSNASDDGGFLRSPTVPHLAQSSGPLQSGVYHLGDSLPRYIDTGGHRSISSNLSASGPQFRQHEIPLTPTDSHTPVKFRASSPGPIAASWRWFHNLSSDLSSVPQASSAERSFPSTVLSSKKPTPQHSWSNSVRNVHEKYSRELPSLRVIHEQLPPTPVSRLARERRPLSGPSNIRADIHHQGDWRQYGRQHQDLPHYSNQLIVDSVALPDPLRQLPHNKDLPSDVYMVMKADNQPPLATSSPPRVRARLAHVTPAEVVPEDESQRDYVNLGVFLRHKKSRGKSEVSPNVSENNSDRPVTYTRDRLQEAIGRVRSGALVHKNGVKYSSAPDLSPPSDPAPRGERTSITSVSSGRGSCKPGSLAHSFQIPVQDFEVTTESRSSSSGIGSRNTSSQQNQSSSQSGQFQTEDTELGHQTKLTTGVKTKGTKYLDIPYQWHSKSQRLASQNPHDLSLDSPRSHSGRGSSHSEPSPSSRGLDASVDDHYEFDTINPICIDPELAEGLRARRRDRGDEKGTSDSEIYGSWQSKYRSSPLKYHNIEARVQAMKEEYQAFRRRQADRRRFGGPLESAC